MPPPWWRSRFEASQGCSSTRSSTRRSRERWAVSCMRSHCRPALRGGRLQQIPCRRRARLLENGVRQDAIMSIEQFIDKEVKDNDVVLFMKGTPQMPMCGFSGQVVQILDHLGVSYKGLNVLDSVELRNGIKTYSNWPTIPQLYVKGEFVGGCDIVREMFQAGELETLLEEKGVLDKAEA